MSAHLHHLGAAQRKVVPRTIRLDPSAASLHTWGRYLDVIRHGLLMIDTSGRAVICTDRADRLHYNMNIERTGKISSRQLLLALCTGTSQSRQDIFEALRGARDLQTSATFVVAGQ
ncbi:hypothetical protein MKL09_21430 [Methylobacterium sp. J-048]|uniref:hypothetical protein n=1 Tax=Methylobacterium sp. J-048 TaxID=2836635 RepID=UPI001FB996CA|nr:hypothetical protein [Methylobacterium sp. J-048]MCJ2059090.1 hypothetical protein [Methylobacterium sp. J-048]